MKYNYENFFQTSELSETHLIAALKAKVKRQKTSTQLFLCSIYFFIPLLTN